MMCSMSACSAHATMALDYEHWTVPAPDYQSKLPQPYTPGAEVECIAGHYPRTARHPEQCTMTCNGVVGDTGRTQGNL
jgi:hypothetical protein